MYCEWSDYGTQRGLLMSVPMFRTFITPYLKRMIDVCHAGGLKFMAHSCGAIRPVIPELIGLGVDILDPIQVAAAGMEPGPLKRDFGDKLAFHGRKFKTTSEAPDSIVVTGWGTASSTTFKWSAATALDTATYTFPASFAEGLTIGSNVDGSANAILAMYDVSLRGGGA